MPADDLDDLDRHPDHKRDATGRFAPLERERITLDARTFGAHMKTSRREWEDRAEYRTSETADDFIRNQLTHTLTADIYSERVDTTRIHGDLEVQCDYERASDPVLFIVVILAMLAGAWTAGMADSSAIVSIGGGTALVLVARLIWERWGITAHVVHSTVPVSADRITWAAYPDAPIPQRDSLGRPVRHIEIASVRYRKHEDS